jgi:hypothetical protein
MPKAGPLKKIRPKRVVKKEKKKALAHNRTVQMMAHSDGDNDVHLMRAIATYNPKLAETREVVTKYIKESEDMKNLGDGLWALRRHDGTIVVIYGVKRRDSKKMRVLLVAAGIFVPDMTRLKRCGLFGGAMSKRERLSRAKQKDSVYPIGDGNKNK